jgi:serine/threonine protein kinase
MPPEVAVWVSIEVAAGLDFAHDALGIDGKPLKLVHRDISPKNIRITHSGSVKVIDFGIARAASRATETAVGTIKGTLGYMSPEQILGDEVDRRADVFAFGIVLFQMLTLRNPFDGTSLKERVKRLTQSPVPLVREFNPTLDSEIEGIVDKALKRDLDERYQRMRDVQIDLDRYLAKLQNTSPRQQLIKFLEEIFPGLHETDPDLKLALTEMSSLRGGIDTSQRLVFPDDGDSDPSEIQPQAVASPGAGGTVSTVKDESLARGASAKEPAIDGVVSETETPRVPTPTRDPNDIDANSAMEIGFDFSFRFG